MPRKTHSTALVLVPPEEVWPRIQEIRRVHDRKFRRWMPHVTLLYPFRPLGEFDALAPRIAEAIRDLEPFVVKLLTFRSFHHGSSSHTVWLAPEPPEPLVRLEEALLGAAPDCNDTSMRAGGFQPHLSVGQFHGSGEDLRGFIEALQAAWVPLEVLAAQVSLIWRGEPPDDIFRVDRALPLGRSGL